MTIAEPSTARVDPTVERRPVPTDDDVPQPFLDDIRKWEDLTGRYLAGELDADVFKAYRLTNGIYGQRQGEPNQMVRIKVPYGSLTPEQLEMIGYLADAYSRRWGHITTRQNIQMHDVQLTEVGEVMRLLASVGLTTREACGDTVRNVQGCHLAGACPFEVLDISAWAEATYEHFVRNPIAQRLPRKFKINFSGCATDCGQAMFNDVGVIAVSRPGEAGGTDMPEAGFRIYLAGGLGANPHPALALEEFTPREALLPTIESLLRVFDQAGNRDNKRRARMKWLVDTIGIDELRRRTLAIRHTLVASTSWPGGIPAVVAERGDAPAGRADDVEPTAIGHGRVPAGVIGSGRVPAGVIGSGPATPVALGAAPPPAPVTTNRVIELGPDDDEPLAPAEGDELERWASVNVVRGAAAGTVSAYANAPLGDITGDQFRALADLQRRTGATVRISNRQNVVFRDLDGDDLPTVHRALAAIGMAAPGAELIRDVVSCPGADTCNLALTQSRGLAGAVTGALEEAGLAEVPGLRINISGCMNSCGQHHVADIGFFGVERRVDGRSAPGYQLMLGGHVGDEAIRFGAQARRIGARTAPAAVVRIVERFVGERHHGEAFAAWVERSGGAAAIGATLDDLDVFDTDEHFVDFGEVGPYAAAVGEAECT